MAVTVNNTKLAEIKAVELIKVKAEYKARCEDWLAPRRHRGFMWNGLPCPGDAEAQANFNSLIALISIGAQGPFLLHDNNNIDHMLSAENVQDLCMHMASFVQGCYQHCWGVKAAIETAVSLDSCAEALAELHNF